MLVAHVIFYPLLPGKPYLVPFSSKNSTGAIGNIFCVARHLFV